MDNKNTQISQLKNEINKLPKGNITYKIIRGKRRMYLQWYEDGATKSSYVKKADEENIKALVNRRKELEFKLRMEAYASKITEDMLNIEASGLGGARQDGIDDTFEMRVVRGDSLESMCKSVELYGRRECYDLLDRYLRSDSYGKVCLIYGLRRTGKTTLVLQAISEFASDETAYIKALSTDTMAMLNRDLQKLEQLHVKYVFIDEITLISDFIDSASLLSDVYAMTGMKIVLSGTDSLGLLLSTDDELYDRTFTIHTTFIPFREYERLLGKQDIDEYIRYGGTFRAGETDFEDPELLDEGASFRDDESARRYIDISSLCVKIEGVVTSTVIVESYIISVFIPFKTIGDPIVMIIVERHGTCTIGAEIDFPIVGVGGVDRVAGIATHALYGIPMVAREHRPEVLYVAGTQSH